MKIQHLIPFIGTALLTLSCVKGIDGEQGQEFYGDAREQMIEASVLSTRTTNDGISTVWEVGDEMTAFFTTTQGFGSAKFTNVSGSQFSGTIRGKRTNPADWYALYPYSEENEDPTEAVLAIPATATQDGYDNTSHLAGAYVPLYGYAKDVADSRVPKLQMHHVATSVEFNITNSETTPIIITGIEMTLPFDLAGSFKGDLTAEEVEWAPVDGQTVGTVSLDVINGTALQPKSSATFSFCTMPFSGKADFKFTIHALVDGKQVSFVRTGNASFRNAAGVIVPFMLDFNLANSDEPVVPEDPDQPDEPTPDEPEAVNGYKLITSEPEDWSGTYLIVDAGKQKVFTGKTDKSNYYTLIDSDMEDDVITNTSLSQYEFTISKNSSNYYLKQGNNYYYVNWSSNSNTGIVTTTTQTAISFGGVQANGSFLFYGKDSSDSNKSKYLYIKSGEDFFKFGGSGGTIGILLYKYTEGAVTPTKRDQTLTFSQSEVSKTLAAGAGFQSQSVSGAETSVTYSSSNTDVATITSDGYITAKASGTTYIKATAASSSQYNAATAQYRLNITVQGQDEPTTTAAYVKVTSEPGSWDGTYLFVDESNGKAFAAFTNMSGSNYAVNVTISNGKIIANDDLAKYALTVTTGKTNAGLHTNGNLSGQVAYNVRNSDGQYIYWSSNFGEYTNATLITDTDNKATNSGTDYYYYHAFKYSNNGVQVASAIDNNGGNAYYLGYNGGFSYNSNGSSSSVQLYKYDGNAPLPDDPTPDDPTPDDPTPQTGDYYVQVTSAPASGSYWDGTYLVVAQNDSYAFAIGQTDNKVAVTINNGRIAYSSALAQYALTISHVNNTKHPNNTSYDAYNVRNSQGKYIYYSNSEIVVSDKNSKENSQMQGELATYYHTFMMDNNGVQMMSSGNSGYNKYYLGYSSTSGSGSGSGFPWGGGYYPGGSTTTSAGFTYESGADTRRVRLFKLNGGSVTPDDPTTPDEPQPSTDKTYTKATSIQAGKAYVIVSNNVALRNNNGTAAAYSVSGKISGSTLTIPAADVSSVEWTTAAAGSSYSTYGDYSFANGGRYISRPGSNDDNITFVTSLGSRTVWSLYGSDDLRQRSTSSSGTYLYMQYSSNQWNASSQSETNAITVYVAGSSTPSEDEPTVDPTHSGETFNLENDYLKAYLDAAERQYTNGSTSSIVSQYIGTSTGGGSWYGGGWYGGGVANDLPKPVTLTWTGSATSITIYEGQTASGTAVKTMSFTSSSTVDVYNLIPGMTYSYKTSNGQTGWFKTEGRRRMIKVSDTERESHARNCRDLGGIKTRDGKTLKYGLIYRGTNVDDISTDEKNILYYELGIRLDQDLRNETNKTSSPIGSDVEFCHHGGYDANSIANQNGDNMKQSVLHVMNAVIEGRPVYFHCRIGSDRTGHMGLLYLALLGCDLKECDIDYEITSFASKMTSGTRTINSGNEQSFRNKFVKSPYTVDSVPEAVESYVTGTLGISLDTVKEFRKAMGASETLK